MRLYIQVSPPDPDLLTWRFYEKIDPDHDLVLVRHRVEVFLDQILDEDLYIQKFGLDPGYTAYGKVIEDDAMELNDMWINDEEAKSMTEEDCVVNVDDYIKSRRGQ